MEARKIDTGIDLRRHETFIERCEDAALDAKEQPYRLDADSEKYELAKDVVALINSGGGVLLLGAKTQRHANDNREYVSELNPFPLALFDSEQWVPNEPGVYIVGDLANRVLDVGEGAAVRDRLIGHDRKECWNRNRNGFLQFLVCRLGTRSEQARIQLEAILRAQFRPVCGIR